jgi:hypothetical protein
MLLEGAARPSDAGRQLRSTLDAGLQRFATATLRRHLRPLAERNVGDGAVVVLDNASGEILAYVATRAQRRSTAPPRCARPAPRSSPSCTSWRSSAACSPPPRCWTIRRSTSRPSPACTCRRTTTASSRAGQRAHQPGQLAEHPGGAHADADGAGALPRPAARSAWQPDGGMPISTATRWRWGRPSVAAGAHNAYRTLANGGMHGSVTLRPRARKRSAACSTPAPPSSSATSCPTAARAA